MSADRLSGACTEALISPDGVRIALVPGNTIDGRIHQLHDRRPTSAGHVRDRAAYGYSG